MILYNKIPSLNGDETQKVFRIGLDSCVDGDTIVEVGCYVGGMTAYMCDLIRCSNKQINFHVVDLFQEEQWLDDGTPMYDRFCKNTEKYTDRFQLHRKDSLTCSDDFEDNSIQFLFLDTTHSPKHIEKELDVWLPKIKKEGIIARHDYHWTGIPELIENKIGDVNVIESSLEYIWDDITWKHTAWWKQV